MNPMDPADPHKSCCHSSYGLTCDQFDALLVLADGCCMRCGQPPPRKLQIDHDHSRGWEAVRGMVCPKCNSHVAYVDRGRKPMDVLTYRYIKEAWWTQARPDLRRWWAWGRTGPHRAERAA